MTGQLGSFPSGIGGFRAAGSYPLLLTVPSNAEHQKELSSTMRISHTHTDV